MCSQLLPADEERNIVLIPAVDARFGMTGSNVPENARWGQGRHARKHVLSSSTGTAATATASTGSARTGTAKMDTANTVKTIYLLTD